MTNIASTARPDTSEMVFVHNCFRQQFRALPGLVRAVPDGDVGRAAVVVDFLAELTAALHHHHEGEDELMWPLLLERAPMDSALILRMEEQHERIAELYRRAADSAAEFVRRGRHRQPAPISPTPSPSWSPHWRNTCTTRRCTSFRWSSR